jgi:hypothetical protein
MGREGISRSDHGAPTKRWWQQAEQRWDQALAAEMAWKQARSALEFFTPEGRFHNRRQAAAVVAAALPHLGGAAWAKTRRLWLRRQGCTFLDQAHQRLAELGLEADVLSALLDLEVGSVNPGACGRRRWGRPRHGPGRWPAQSNWPRRNPTGKIKRSGFARCCVGYGVPAAWWNASTAWPGCSQRATAR